MWSTCSDTIFGIEDTSVSQTEKVPASWGPILVGETDKEEEKERQREGREFKEFHIVMKMPWRKYKREWVRQACPRRCSMSWA